MQFSTADLRGFNALPLKKRREFLALCAMLESDEPEQRTEYPSERQGVRSEDANPGDSLSGLRKHQARGGRPAKRKGVTVAEATGLDGQHLQILDGGIVSSNDQQHQQELPEG
jgi:hypothetical protein